VFEPVGGGGSDNKVTTYFFSRGWLLGGFLPDNSATLTGRRASSRCFEFGMVPQRQERWHQFFSSTGLGSRDTAM
jgi:hypothetical protein